MWTWLGGGHVMGLFDRIFRRKRKQEEKKVRYVLVKMTENGGWANTGITFDSPVSYDDIYDKLSPGKYRLLEDDGSGKFGRNVWGKTLEVKLELPEDIENVQEKPRRREKMSDVDALQMLFTFMANMEKLKEDYKGAYSLLKKFFEGPDIMEVSKILEDYRQKFDTVARALGYARAESVPQTSPPEYEGKLPIWMHPQAIKGVMGAIRDGIREIASDLGLSEEKKGESSFSLNLPQMPSEGEESGEGNKSEEG